MIETKDITNMVRHILKRDKGIADTQMMHPTREWFTGLGITCVVVALGSWLCFYLFTFYTNEMQKEVIVTEQAVPYQAANIKNALELYAIKQQKYNEIIGKSDMFETAVLPLATSTIPSPLATTTENIDVPELIIDPPPTLEDEDVAPATLAP